MVLPLLDDADSHCCAAQQGATGTASTSFRLPGSQRSNKRTELPAAAALSTGNAAMLTAAGVGARG